MLVVVDAVGELRVLIGGAIDVAGGATPQPVEILLDAERTAERGIERIFAQARLDVRTAGIVGADVQPQLGIDTGVVG